MGKFFVIFKKELKSYFNSPIAYIFITVFIVLMNWLFFRTFFIIKQSSMRTFFSLLPWFLLFFAPALTMRLWAEEKKAGTLEFLMTMPISDFAVTFGKYLAAVLLLSLTIILTLTVPFSISKIGNLDFGQIIGQYLGAILLGASLISIGLFFSSLTENQIIAFIITIVLSFILIIIGEPFIVNLVPDYLSSILKYISLISHYDSIGRGIIDSKDIIYYFSVIFLFIFLNLKTIESRKWK
ncbi:MAG TPA: ABC transporter permease [bacterium]|nr:ABC transporter permease [bacterium]HOL48798.1 ABC transporter permease [bacterium]HPQ19234.1 ABC transporter permease [bacterium]